MNNYLKNCEINPGAVIPIYLQLVDVILEGIRKGELQKGENLPSIHQLHTTLEISKSSVERAYNKLKDHGVISSFKGKGYFVADQKNSRLKRVLRIAKYCV